MTCTEAMNAVALREVLQALVSECFSILLATGKCPTCPADTNMLPGLGHASDLRHWHNEKCALRLAQEELERTA